MSGYHYLSDEDVKVLKELLSWKKNQPPARRTRPLGDGLDRTIQTPDVYIALPPTDGIPALTRAQEFVGTSSGSSDVPNENDRPGVALCTLAMITNVDSSLPTLTELSEIGMQYVYNLSHSVIGQDWIHIHRDKFGRWLAITGGGCDPQNTILQITIFGKPSGGSFTLDLTVNGVRQTLTISFSSSTFTTQGVFEGHSQIGAGQVVVTGAAFPSATQQIEFVSNLKNTDIAIPTFDWSSLTGGTGVAVLGSLAQKGHS